MLLAREVTAAIARHEIPESEIAAFSELGITPLLDLKTLMRSWAMPVGGKFTYATLAACGIEMIRRSRTDVWSDHD